MTTYYKKAIIDSVVWIGAKNKKDQYDGFGDKIIDYFNTKNINKIYITDYILLETISFLLKKSGFDIAYETLNMFLQHERIEIVYVDELMLQDMRKLFEKYKDLSLTDCSIICLMKDKNIKYLFSFDSGFDKVKEIVRKEDV